VRPPAPDPEIELHRGGLGLDASDELQADQAPERSPASGAHVAGSPPASGPIDAADPSLKAAGLGPRPSVGSVRRIEGPAPHPRPTRTTDRPPPGAPPPPGTAARPPLPGALANARLERPRSDPSRAAGAGAASAAAALSVPVALLSAAPTDLGGEDEATFSVDFAPRLTS
jgi:hypothetical protein